LSQNVTIPGPATLRFRYAIDTWEDLSDPTIYDALGVFVTKINGGAYATLLTLGNPDWTDSWVQSPVLNIPPEFIGVPVKIEFIAITDPWDPIFGETPTFFFIDNVVLSLLGAPLTERVYLPLILK
jgi:hypothetical protein